MLLRVAGRPVLPRTDLAAQRRPTMSRCQRRIVSGVTSSRSPWRRDLGITLSRAASSARSAHFRCGRRGCRRCSTASWWRRIKIPAICHASSRRDSRSHVVTRVMRRKANRRHMTRDRDGQAARKATQLVRTVDGTLGTHRFSMTDILLPLASVTVYTAPTGPVRLFDGFGAAVAGTAVAGAAAGSDWAVAHRR